MGNAKMNTDDAINGSLGTCYITYDGKRYNMFTLINVKAEGAISYGIVKSIGRLNEGRKASGYALTWSAEGYYCNPLFKEIFMNFKRSGKNPTFDMQITNEDEASSAGRQVALLKGCGMEKFLIAALDSSSDDPITESLSGFADDVEFPEKFSYVSGIEE